MTTTATKVARRFLARRGMRLDSSTRRKANAALRRKGFDGSYLYRTMGGALSAAFDVLKDHGMENDEIILAFNEPTGSRNFEMAFSDPDDPFSPVPISNSVFRINWTEMQSGRFEVIAYLS